VQKDLLASKLVGFNLNLLETARLKLDIVAGFKLKINLLEVELCDTARAT
jgi:hypothetical protein